MRTAIGFALAYASGLISGAALVEYRRRSQAEVGTNLFADSSERIEAERERLRKAREFSPEAAVEHAAVAARYLPEPPKPNAGIHLITETEYMEDEDFDKSVLEVFEEDELEHFVLDGTRTMDVLPIFGETWVFFQNNDEKETFYVRNHLRKTDYEVCWAKP